MEELCPNFALELKLQTEDVHDLLSTLKNEAEAISSRQAKKIKEFAEHKNRLINQIQHRDVNLIKTLSTTELSDETKAEIEAIKLLLSECHRHNEVNGVILQRAQLSMHKLRNLLQETLGKEQLTYDQDGNASGGRTLGTNFRV